MKYQQGSLRKVDRKEGKSWLHRFQVTKDGRRVENARIIGLVADLPTESAVWKRISEMGLLAEINKDNVEVSTFGVLALRYLDAKPHDDAVVYYVKKVMIPAFGDVRVNSIRRKDVRDWLKTLD